MNEQRGWIIARHVALRTKWVKEARFLLRIVPREDLRPKALLAAIEIKFRAAQFLRLFFGHERLLTVVRVWLAVPRSSDVAVAPERNERPRRRANEKTGHQGQIASSGLPHDDHVLGVDMKEFRALPAHPRASVPQIFEYLRQLGLRGEPVIDRNDDV